jgi:hypothetical protein
MKESNTGFTEKLVTFKFYFEYALVHTLMDKACSDLENYWKHTPSVFEDNFVF